MSLIGTFVTAGDVDAKKADLATQIEAFDKVVKGSTAIPGALAGEWSAWSSATLAFCHEPTGFFTAGDENDEALSKEKEFNAWRAQLSGLMHVAPPPDVLPPAPPPVLNAGLDPSTKGLIALGLVAIILGGLRR